jgi:hypothetical protein
MDQCNSCTAAFAARSRNEYGIEMQHILYYVLRLQLAKRGVAPSPERRLGFRCRHKAENRRCTFQCRRLDDRLRSSRSLFDRNSTRQGQNMTPAGESRSTGQAMKHWRAAILGKTKKLGALLLLPTLLTGCVSDGLFSDRSRSRDRDRDRDPLTGLPSRVPAEPRGVPAGAANDRITPATLAGGSSARGDGVSGLGIRDGNNNGPDNSGVPTGGAWSGAESKAPAPGGVKLGSPRLGGPTDSYTQPTSGGANRSPAIRVQSFEEAQQFLMAHGVKWQRLQMIPTETGPGEWLFSCTIPTKTNSSSMKTYEAKDRYGRVAMQKVIDEIVRDQGTR